MERGWMKMWYVILVLIIFILVIYLYTLITQIRNLNGQIQENRPIRISLFSKYIEELASQIIEKDIEHKKLQIQIKQEEEQLKQSISNISHDLRTPLTSMQGYLTLLQECKDEEEQKQFLDIIKVKADYLTELIQEFYDLSLLEHAEFDIEIQRVDINRIVTDCVLEKYCEFKDVQPIIQTENNPVWIIGNDIVCKRIIENLIVNAIRYSDDYIEISINSNGVFTIKNSTHLSDDINVESLFEKFYTADKSRTRGSSGLGLYIVKELLNKIGGVIGNVNYKDKVLIISIQFSMAN